MAGKLPAVRRRVRRALDGDPTVRETVLAAAIRLLDLGLFRPGAEEYADENGSYGLLTLERRHVCRDGDELTFCFVAKAGVEQEVTVRDAALSRVVAALTKRRSPDARLLATKVDGQWHAVEPAELNDRLRELFGMDVTAKDFRTWHATVTVAAALAATDRAESRRGRAKQIRAAVGEAAELLGNTVAIARSSYVDPRVVDLFEDGRAIQPTRSRDRLERAVVELLTG